MLVVTRYAVPVADAAGFLDRARAAVAALAERPGFRRAWVGRAVDDGATYVLASDWDDVGSYRRALSSYEVKVAAVPLLSEAIDEPSAFEVLHGVDGGVATDRPSGLAADAGSVGLGRAAGPDVPALPS